MSTRKLFGTNGIRGLVNVELTPEIAIQVASAIGTFFGKSKNILLGYDARTSGPMFAHAVTSGLNAAGCNVYFAGMASTPAIQFAVKNHKMDGGVIVSASHNPPQYNGIKVIWSDGIETSHEQETEIENIYFENKIVYASWDKLGTFHELPTINDEYKDSIKKHVNIKRYLQSSTSWLMPHSVRHSPAAVAKELGCKCTTINANTMALFPEGS